MALPTSEIPQAEPATLAVAEQVQIQVGKDSTGIKYVAVAQDVDRFIFARYDCDPEGHMDYDSFVLQILGAPDYRHQTTAGSLYSLPKPDIDRTFHMLLQEEDSEIRLVYFAITNCSFPPFSTGEFLRKLRREVDMEFPAMVNWKSNDEKTEECNLLIKKLVDKYAGTSDPFTQALKNVKEIEKATEEAKENLNNVIKKADLSLQITEKQKAKAMEFDKIVLDLRRSEFRKQCW
eukprot:CAMPEP_0204823102 /NCGR_PEP_ID=MMETSP1346-20131115/1236_1 /ASSEMBLY_ACC=CAM_ASM_000771 /TAXON_ID=215587 /ORGANISM="Aplanochytrium stocchinoi, Strain GSBS06" /LENGTH=233 /DNA_ID=CAMNT_0051949635 /DNA_START=426 /DNA_END=1124 /DNA_ORIENTATION=+